MDMEQFLGHRTGGSRSSVLKNWKDDGKILVWLNRNAGIHCLWRHPFYRRVDLKDKPPDVWSDRVRCFDSSPDGRGNEEILVNRFRRDDTTDERLFPPTCGFCRFLEDLRRAIRAGEVSWTDEVFVFRAGQKRVAMHAGGLVGMFGSKDLSDEQKAEMASVGVYTKDAWKYDGRVKPEYLFVIANGNDPKAGLQSAIQPKALGDKMKVEIGKQIKARGAKGDPTQHPYPFLWEYSESGSFDDAYTITAMTEEKPSPEILKLIEAPGPDLSQHTRGYSRKMVRTMLEQACVLDVGGWGQYFPDQPDEPEQQARPERTPEVKGPAPEDDLCECDGCGKPMKVTAPKCPSCGKSYEVEGAPKELPPPPAPPPLRKRSETKKEQAASQGVAPNPGVAQPAQQQQSLPGPGDAFAGAFEGGNDDLPF